jgi:hypothetical protein
MRHYKSCSIQNPKTPKPQNPSQKKIFIITEKNVITSCIKEINFICRHHLIFKGIAFNKQVKISELCLALEAPNNGKLDSNNAIQKQPKIQS